MTDDDKDKDDAFDPWADLEADDTPDPTDDLADGFSFSFADASLDAGLDVGSPAQVPGADESAADVVPPDAEAGEGAEVDEPVADAFEAEKDGEVSAWLDEPTEPIGDPPLTVFAPDESAIGGEPEPFDAADAFASESPASETEPQEEAGDVDLDVLGLFDESADPAAPVGHDAVSEISTTDAGTDIPGSEPDHGEVDLIDFETAAAGAAAAAAIAGPSEGEAAELPRPSAPATRARRGILGQLVGVIAGGLLAIPIVLGILIGLMWGGWRDTLGIRSWMPQQLAFLLPAPPNRASGVGGLAGADSSAAPSLDDLPAVPAQQATEPSAEPVAEDVPVAEPAEPAPLEEAAVAAVATTDAPTDEPPMTEEAPANTEEPGPGDLVADPPAAEPAAPALDELAALMPTPVEPAMPAAEVRDVVGPVVPQTPALPEPEPIDLSSLETAVAEADAALEAVRAEEDATGLPRKKRLVEWYRHLVRLAEELALVERLSADSGRPLDVPPAAVVDLQAKVLAADDLREPLAKLGRDWLGYSRREGDGVVLPATFVGVRQVGPYSCSRVSIADAGGKQREVTIISRSKPAAREGDAVLVIGLVMDGGVIWASDLRGATAEPQVPAEPAASAPAEADPFGLQSP